jgi:hypothetical protein
MAVSDVLPLPTAVPVSGGKLETGASVLVMLGKDKASLTLDQMSGAAATSTPAATTASSVPTAAPTTAKASSTTAKASSTTAKASTSTTAKP